MKCRRGGGVSLLYHAIVRRFSRLLAVVLLATLALDLGDWPYMDEILADLSMPATSADQLGRDAQESAPRNSGAPHKAAGTYQVLLHMGQLAVREGIAMPVMAREAQAPPSVAAVLHDSFRFTRLDRPPKRFHA